MSEIVRVPDEFAVVRDQLVAAALNEGPPPERSAVLEAFQNWLLYESEAMNDQYFEPVISVNDLEFDDEEMRLDLDIPDAAELTNEQRAAYGRSFIERYEERSAYEPSFVLAFELQRADGKSAFYCALGSSIGQGGFDAYWDQAYLKKEDFFDALRSCP